jgi:hypothetical protein
MAHINIKDYNKYNLNYDEISNIDDIILIFKALNMSFHVPKDEIHETFIKLIEKNLIIQEKTQ